MSDLLERLENAGVLQPVDAALGGLLMRRCARDGAIVGAAGALASAALAQGHSCVPLAEIPNLVAALGGGDIGLPTPDDLRAALSQSPWVARDAQTPAALVLDGTDRLYLQRYFRYERAIAADLRRRAQMDSATPPDADMLRALIARHFGADDTAQAVATLLALRSRLLVLTGAPGTGKTTTVLRLLAVQVELALQSGRDPPRVALTAPTGKAAARLSETLRAQAERIDASLKSLLPDAATTVHRLLGVTAGGRKPQHDAANPLPYDVVVVDEASMLDLALAARLCTALLPSTQLILVGDRHQLASVEAGSVFGAICAAAGQPHEYSTAMAQWLGRIVTGDVPRNAAPPPLADSFVELDRSHRFGQDSAIGRLAAAVLDGDAQSVENVIGENDPAVIARTLQPRALGAVIITEIVPRYAALAQAATPQAAFELADRFRVLCALREGPFGATALNTSIENELRRMSQGADADGWYHGRLVMITTNDHRRRLFNGDIGVALATGDRGTIEVWFPAVDGRLDAFPPALLPAHQSAYALTVHKAQGSEFESVLVVLPQRDARVLGRELLYTALTRARREVMLWMNADVLSATLARSTVRWSGLADALSEKPLAYAEGHF